MKKYSVLLCDPPWEYRHCASKSREISNHYPTMKLEDIKALQVPSDDNCVLYLWATAPKLLEALEVMTAWGFDYRSCMTWDKEIIGMGYWFRGQHELLLVGVKGKISPPPQGLRISSVWRERRTRHSKKPIGIRDMIAKWYPLNMKLEMFAREKTENFDSWGNEVDSDIQLNSGLEK